jgi:hypothetical protein
MIEIRRRIDEIKEITLKPPYLYMFLVILISYFAFNIYINNFYEIIPFFLNFNLAFLIPYTALTILIGLLVAANMTIVIWKLKNVLKLKDVKEEGSFTIFGMFGGLLGGACPGCFVGLLPTIAGVFGVTVTLSSLPFYGFEIQIPTAIILLGTLIFATRKNVCKIKIK